MRGATPLDVAAASVMDNNELALALTESDLEKVFSLLIIGYKNSLISLKSLMIITAGGINVCACLSRSSSILPAVDSKAALCCWLKATLILAGILWKGSATWIFSALLSFAMVTL